ncbi:FkbM family methyltransferase [Dyella humi]|uniref:FkbM family methyltransferase n=1 Tax=Dyella humi TaxID=1770547 RepID=A0ABW8IMI0_9GAMM
MTFVSYAQNYEDVMLHRALKHVVKGFYVDVGAQHPVNESVTKAFYECGWHGINIEPMTTWFTLLESDRPHDINLNVAATDQSGDLVMFEVEETGLSTTNREFAESYREEGRVINERCVPALSLDQIFVDHGVTEVHFMKVDCEGCEKAALSSASLTAVRPWIIVVEAMEPNSQVPTHERWEYLLTGRGYQLAYKDGLNRFYVADERSELIAAFDFPPNIFDQFVRARDRDAHLGVNDAHERLRAALVELAQSKTVTQQLSDTLRLLSEEQALLRATFEQARAENVNEREILKTQLESHKAEIVALLLGRDELTSQLQQARAGSFKQVSAARAAADGEIQELLLRQQELIRHIEALRVERDHRAQDVHALMLSTSWRITAPLRASKTFIRANLGKVWRFIRPAVARAGRASRPSIRWLLQFKLLRVLASKLLGPHTRLGRRLRTFLYPPQIGVQTTLAMSTDAAAIETMLRTAIAREAERY